MYRMFILVDYSSTGVSYLVEGTVQVQVNDAPKLVL